MKALNFEHTCFMSHDRVPHSLATTVALSLSVAIDATLSW